MNFLFMATLGPLQPFIASSRRTCDLFAGSMLLSELSRAAAYAIANTEIAGKDSLIFPAPLSLEMLSDQGTRPLNVANKIVAIIEQTPTVLGKAVKKAIDDRLNEVKKEVFGRLDLLEDRAVNAQISNLVEYSWVAVPFDQVSEYEQARERAETILGARKNTLFFSPVTWGSEQEKSSIDGRLESVIPPDQYPNSSINQNDKIKYLYAKYKAGPHERLSAVDLLKRLGLKSLLPTVFSTSHIAATPFLERLKNISEQDQNIARGLWDTYIEKVEALAPLPSIVERLPLKLLHPVIGNIDGALFFEERLFEDLIYRDKFATAKEALTTFFRFTDPLLAGLRPSPYYSVLLADGDGMGKAIEAQAANGPDGHRNISRALALFADKVPDIVTEHGGALVYAGGDDVLALLPLHTALDCARKLSETFKEALKTFEDSGGHTPTLSAGMAVVHHVSLLQDALTLVRSAEHTAKDQQGKNALAIYVQKRGGEPVDVVVGFPRTKAQDQPIPILWPPIEEFEILTKLCEVGIIPGGMAYELRDMHQRLQTTVTDPEFKQLQRVIQIEAARIVRRKLFFSQHSTSSQAYDELEKLLIPFAVPRDDNRQKPPTMQERALAFLLACIGVKQDTTRSFEITDSKEIAPFIDALIVAQVFAEPLLPDATKGTPE